jgi:hypothetical protein
MYLYVRSMSRYMNRFSQTVSQVSATAQDLAGCYTRASSIGTDSFFAGTAPPQVLAGYHFRQQHQVSATTQVLAGCYTRAPSLGTDSLQVPLLHRLLQATISGSSCTRSPLLHRLLQVATPEHRHYRHRFFAGSSPPQVLAGYHFRQLLHQVSATTQALAGCYTRAPSL